MTRPTLLLLLRRSGWLNCNHINVRKSENLFRRIADDAACKAFAPDAAENQ